MLQKVRKLIKQSIHTAGADIIQTKPKDWPAWLTLLVMELRDSLVDPVQFDAVWTETKRRVDERLAVHDR